MTATASTSRERDVIIRMMWQLSRTTAALALAVAAVSPARAGGTSLNDVLRHAGAYVRQFENDFSAIITDEQYEQEYSRDTLHEHRSLRSEDRKSTRLKSSH